MIQLPEKYQKEMQELLQEDYPLYLKSFEKSVTRSLRVNTLKISVEDFLKRVPFHLTPVKWSSDGFYYEESDNVTSHPYYYAGLYYLQEASAMLPAEALPVKKGDRVLDACAAPGGKSLKLASKLNGSGLLLSNDISASRAQALLRNVEKSGVRNALVTSEDIRKLAMKYPQYFDGVLVDAPCSGEGMFHRDESLIKSYEERGTEYYSPLQKEIILSASKLVKEGGYLLYSTCTFSKEEDEDVVEHLLAIDPTFHVIPLQNDCEEFVFGMTENCRNARRLYPHRLNGEGHFVALLQKDGTSEAQAASSQLRGNCPKEVRDFLSLLSPSFLHGELKQIKDALYLLPEEIDNSSIRTLRSGLLLGELHNGRFEPSQALAMALKAEDFPRCIHFKADDIRVEKYLRGETIQADEEGSGWVLVCVDEFPLGWGKMQGRQIKNKIKSGVRKL